MLTHHCRRPVSIHGHAQFTEFVTSNSILLRLRYSRARAHGNSGGFAHARLPENDLMTVYFPVSSAPEFY